MKNETEDYSDFPRPQRMSREDLENEIKHHLAKHASGEMSGKGRSRLKACCYQLAAMHDAANGGYAVLERMPPEHEADLAAIAAHEAGHEVAARHYGRNPRVFLGGPKAGTCVYAKDEISTDSSPRADAIISWAGVMAEALLGDLLPHSQDLPPITASSWPVEIQAWASAVKAREISGTDRQGIVLADIGAAESAHRLLAALHFPELLLRQAQLVIEHRERFQAAVVRASEEADREDVETFKQLMQPNTPPAAYVAFMRALPAPPGGHAIRADFGIPIATPRREPGYVRGTKPR